MEAEARTEPEHDKTSTRLDDSKTLREPKHTRSSRARLLLAVVILSVVSVTIAVPCTLLLNKNGGTNVAHTMTVSFVASGSIGDYAGTKRTDMLNVLSSAAGLGSTAPRGSTLEITAASVNLIGTLPVASESAVDSAIHAFESAVPTPAALTSLLVAGGVSGVTVEHITSVDKAAQLLSELDQQLVEADVQLMAHLELEPYDSCGSLVRSMRLYPGENWGRSVRLSARYGDFNGDFMMPEAEDAVMAMSTSDTAGKASAAGAASDATADAFSSTNVQVEGIDEADIVKNDGRFIYSIGGSQLVIIRAYPEELRGVVSRTSLRTGQEGEAAQLFAAEESLLDGDMLLILSAAQLSFGSREFAAVVSQAWNVSDRASPTLVGSATFEGSLVTARLLSGIAYAAISSNAHLVSSPGPVPLSSDVMPLAWTNTASIREEAAPVAACEDVSYMPDVQPRSLLTLTSIALTTPGVRPGDILSQRTVATGSSWREASVYMSFAAIYVATYNSEYVCSTDSGSSCRDNEWWCIDSRSSKRAAWSSCTFSAATYIISFGLSGNGSMAERARGAVPGYLLSQWSLDEFDGYLRVAYTRPQGLTLPSGGVTEQTDNAVDVLDAHTLSRVGRVRGLGGGERIYAMRFAGALGYMVTFRQVDPLYTLDLANPTRPIVLGELKIPGYSDYLHPINDNTLLGIGAAGDDSGVVRGVKLALFDISNLLEPREVGVLELGGRASATLVSDDHRAMLYDPNRQLLVLPITEKNGWGCNEPIAFHGAKVFTLTGNGFELRTAIEHGPARSSTQAFPQRSGCASQECNSAKIRRSLYVGDDLFTVSDSEVRATSLMSFSSTWETSLYEPEVLAKEGSCTLNDAPLPWLRVAASGDDIYCSGRYQACRPADTALRNRFCNGDGSRSFEALLSGAIAPCGNFSCADEVVYNPCKIWF
uniref:Uncharacterized protein n=1 Tax=Haptolina brevifila TaxID=156173 RepID=A0A7S2BRP2_9EUKA